MEQISYKLEVFEGPMDLLLHLITVHKPDIYDLPIVELVDQYTDYVRKMQTVYAWLIQYPDEGLDDRYRSVNVAYDGLLYARKNEIQPPKSADF